MIPVVYPGSGFFLPIPDPGSRGQKRHRIPDLDPQNCKFLLFSFILLGVVLHVITTAGKLNRLVIFGSKVQLF
jgi:hypothetical protein